MKSIRIYLVVVLISVVCLSNFVAALHGYQSSMQEASELIDLQIAEKGKLLAVLLADPQDYSFYNSAVDKVDHRSQDYIASEGVRFKKNYLPSDLFDENTLFQIWNGESLLSRSNNAPDAPFISSSDGYHYVSYEGVRWRTWVYPLVVRASPFGSGDDSSVDTQNHAPGRRQALIIVGQRANYYSILTEDILLKAILPIIWVLPIVGVLVWIIVSLGLGPLSHLAKVLNRRKVGDFSSIAGGQYPVEMQSIVSSMNQLFQRLLEAFERERRLSADAAHELRTPLAALKVGLHNLSKTAGPDSNLDSLEASVNRMGHSIEQILDLHRMSSEKSQGTMAPCDLQSMAKSVIADLYAQIEARGQSIELESEAAIIYGDQFALSVMLRNLIDNARKYTPEDGEIKVSIANFSGTIEVLVEDSGAGIPESEYDRVQERFYRIGGDRHDSGVTGSGLGLSIVSFIVRLHEGTIRFSRSSELGGLQAQIVLSTEMTGEDK